MGHRRGEERLDRLEEVLTKLHSGDRTGQTYFDLILLGASIYKPGLGLPHMCVHEVIEKVTGEKFPSATESEQ